MIIAGFCETQSRVEVHNEGPCVSVQQIGLELGDSIGYGRSETLDDDYYGSCEVCSRPCNPNEGLERKMVRLQADDGREWVLRPKKGVSSRDVLWIDAVLVVVVVVMAYL